MKLISFLLFFCFLHQNVSAQYENYTHPHEYPRDTLRVDRSNNPISKITFDHKLNSSIFAALKFEDDSTVLYRLRFSYMFGKLTSEKKKQMYQLLHDRNQVDTTKIMIIHYQDTLRSIESFPKKSTVKYAKDSLSHRHISNHKAFIRQHKKCLRRNKKGRKNNVYHFFGYNEGHPTEFKKVKWKQDYLGLIDHIYKDAYGRFNTIILHPNGTFVGYNYADYNGKVYRDLIRGKRWEMHKEDFDKRVMALDAM